MVIHPDPRFGFPAPLPKEVEAAMETLGERGKVNKILKGCSQEHIEGPTYWDANDDAALAVIKEALLAGAWAIRDRQAEAALSKPAPLPKEVEEAMDTARKAIESLPTNSLCVTLRDMGLDALAIIQAALRPKVVSREWIRKRADWAGCLGVTDVAGILRELGIEVSEGEMR